jgi:pimeloyl-ACP methyl ester carboxylesterase
MTQLPAPNALPIAFEAAGGQCFGWFHAAAEARARGVGVVLCRPLGYEAMCTYRSYTRLAGLLAQAGFDVLRFDYHGTGDSAGGDADPGRVAAWTASITAAAHEIKRVAGVSRLALFGVRLGATLAVQAAAQLGGVESLVLWAPCATGRAFVRELRAAGASRPDGAADAAVAGTPTGDIEALGYLYTAQTVRDLQSLDCQKVETAPARRVLIVGRDDLPAEGPLPGRYRAMGIDTTYAALPGYSHMMTAPHETYVEESTLAVICDWLAAAPEAGDVPAAHWATAVSCTEGYDLDGVRERPLAFGAGGSLFGILAEPRDAWAQERRLETAILMLNVGGNYRIGPNRLHVKIGRFLAAAGYRTLRFDLAGIGDSAGGVPFDGRKLYARDAAPDVQAAIDALAARGCKNFWLVGICSGSFVAFQTALADRRVTGQILMNSRLLEWCEDWQEAGPWRDFVQSGYKSTDFYRRALLQPQVYRRMLRGEIDVTGIARRIGSVLQAHLKRALGGLLRRAPGQESVLAKFKRLSARGTDTLLIVSAVDDGRDYLEFHLGARGSRMRGHPNFRMLVIEGSDHTFSSAASQKTLLATVQDHLDRRTAPEPEAGSLAQPAPVAHKSGWGELA